MDAVASSPGTHDQFVLVSPAFGDVAALGQDNQVLEVAGSAHAEEMFVTSARAEVMEAIVRRLSS